MAVDTGLLEHLAAAERLGVAGAAGNPDLVMAAAQRAWHEELLVVARKQGVAQPGKQSQRERCPDQPQLALPCCVCCRHASEPVGLHNVETEQRRQRPEQNDVQP